MPKWVRSNDPIPYGHIRLSEAFDLFYQAVTPNWRRLDTAIKDAKRPVHGAEVPRWDNEVADPPLVLALNARDSARSEADMKFRAALAAGELRAMIRDSDKGTMLELSREGWGRAPTSGDGAFPGGFDEDFVEPGDIFQPGPAAAVGGYLRPVFFDRKNFNSWLLHLVPGARAAYRPGRKPDYDRDLIRSLVFENMDHHGEFSADDPKWKCLADLERTIANKLNHKHGQSPAESTLRKLIKSPLADWRARKADN